LSVSSTVINTDTIHLFLSPSISNNKAYPALFFIGEATIRIELKAMQIKNTGANALLLVIRGDKNK